MPVSESEKGKQFFESISKGDSEQVRNLLVQDKELSTFKLRGDYKYPREMELEALKFLGAYIGSITGLQYAILQGHDGIARDLVDSTFEEDLNEKYGGNNTALHLAAFMGAREIVKLLLERGADKTAKNHKGFTPIDLVDDPEMQSLFNATRSSS